MEATVYIATSFDGFIAREDGSLDWLVGSDGGQNDEESGSEAGQSEDGDLGFGEFMAGIDALVMGRSTFEIVAGFDGPWPYGDTPVFVLSRSMTELPEGTPDTVALASLPPAELAKELHGKGLDSLYVDGGQTIQSFLAAGLITRLIVTRMPVIIGTGIPLFGPVPSDIHLKHVDTTATSGGFVQSTYLVVSE